MCDYVLLRRTATALCAIALIFLPWLAVRAQSANVSSTPPMGWNSWNHFGEKVNDADVRAAADAMVASGMRDA
ncbi:MAG: glycoside hydrolase family 27 protein, partial [Acidobacteriaceae bacterium]